MCFRPQRRICFYTPSPRVYSWGYLSYLDVPWLGGSKSEVTIGFQIHFFAVYGGFFNFRAHPGKDHMQGAYKALTVETT